MAFFNKKEDVIDIELTQYGRDLLSKGKLKPAYYAFSDDEIIYDPSYNTTGSTESKQETFERIVRKNIRTKTLYDSDSAEERVLKLNGHSFETNKSSGLVTRSGKINKIPVDELYGKDYIDDIGMEPEKRSLFRNILGKAQIGNQNVPAWKIESLNNQKFKSPIFLSSSRDTGVGPSLKTPLIEIDIDYRTFTYEDTEDYTEEMLDSQPATSRDITFKDAKRVLVDDQKVLLDFFEENIELQKENFDIEFYIVEEETVETENSSGVVVREEKESLRRLLFAPPYEKFSDKQKYIDTYFHIEFDAEISEQEFADKGTDDVLRPGDNFGPAGSGENENLVGNLYDNFLPTEDDEDCD